MESSERPDKPLSILDLAIVFMRYRAVFFIVLFVVLLGALILSLVLTPTYRFTSVIALAERPNGQLFTGPDSVVAMVNSHWLPSAESELKATDGKKAQFDTKPTVVGGGELIKLISEASIEQLKTVKFVHERVARDLLADQDVQYEKFRKRLEQEIEETEDFWNSLKEQEVSDPALAAATEQLMSLKGDIRKLTKARLVSLAGQSRDPTSMGPLLMLMFAALLGIGTGIFCVYIVAFYTEVRREWLSLQKQAKEAPRG